MGPLEVAIARDALVAVDKLIHESTVSVTLEESLGSLIADGGDSLLCMDILRMENLWRNINQQKIKMHALDYLFTKLSGNKHERTITQILWGLDVLIEKAVFTPREVAHSLVCCDQLRVDCSPFFSCAFKLLLKLIFFLDYKSNREVFNKSIEKSSQFTTSFDDNRNMMRVIDPAVELIQLLLSREMCLMPAYFAMHELIRSFPGELGAIPHKSIQQNIPAFMDSFAKPARLLYCHVHRSIKPFSGVTPPHVPGFRLDSTNLILTSIKGAMRYPDFLTSTQLPLLCFVLGQLRSTELAAGMLDLSAGRIKSRSVGLELALVEWIVDIMELTESTDDRRWVRTIFEHLISLVITFMLSSTIRFNEIVVKLNSRLEGRIWTRSSRHIMWFVLNATSGFIGKNMLTDFVPCLRLFDILFPEAEDPDRAIELQTGVCGKFCAQRPTDQDAHSGSAFGCPGDIEQTDTTDDSMQVPKVECPELPSSAAALPLVHDEDSNTVLESKDDETEEEVCLTTTSAEDSEDESSLSIVPPNCHHSTICRRRQSRFMYLTTASVCLWQHVLRKSRTGYDHLPRVMPPALRPMEARIAYRMRSLTDAVRTLNSPDHTSSIASQLTWRQFVVVLNAYSTDNEAGQLIQQLVDLFWLGTPEDDTPDASPEYGRLWHKLMHNGTVLLPYGLVAQGRLQPLSNHLIRTMSVHLRMLVLHLFLQKISSLPFSEQLTTPGVMETLCRLLACREVEPSNVSRILNLLPKLQPMHPPNGWDVPEHSPSATVEQCSPPASYLLSTLLDTLGHRLADTLLPELQVQTLVAMVNLLRLWTAWSTLHPPSDSDETRTGSDGRTCSTDIPLDLMHALEWTVIKLIRNLQSPDCVLYGLCSSISPACLAQAQAQASSASSSSNSAAYVPPNSAPSSGASSNPPRARPSQPSAPDGSASTSTSCDAPSTNAVVLPAPFPAYPFLMTECLELNRFILFSLLQIYYAYDLDEISAMKAFLVEQIRTMCERCGPHSLTELPRFILNRLPEFLMHIMRQRSSPCFTGSSISISAETSERRQSLVTLPLMVLDEFNRLTDNGTTWTMIAGRSNLILCVALRYSAVHGSVPKSIMNVITRMPNAQLNTALRALCDYTVACECGMQSCDELMLQNCVSALSSLCVTYRVVPLDRFILFLMTHTNYQGAQLNAVNQILVHLLTRSGPLLGAIQYLNARFPIPMDCSSSPTTGRPSLHPNPVSSRSWPECVLHLHSILPDQYFLDNSSRSIGMSAPSSPSQPLPVIYGHLLLRLLPLLESVLSQFLDSNLPLLQLIPFCREISPLFRFHRRPVSVCYVLLREHWHFTPLDPDAFILHDGLHPSPLSGDRRFNWFVDRLRVQILVHCVLKHHHALASAVSCRHAGKQNETDSSAAGLFTHKGWYQLQFTADTCDRLHQDISTLVSSNTITAHDAEIQLKSQLFDWFIARPNGPDVEWVASLLVPIRRSTVSHGIHGHPSAWRPWNFEENVSIQAAGLYAGAVEVMCSFCSPSDFVSSLTEFFSHRLNDPAVGDFLNVTGALSTILPTAYRLALCHYCVSLFGDPILTDCSPATNWQCSAEETEGICDTGSDAPNTRWRRSQRAKRHFRLLYPDTYESRLTASSPVPPRVAVNFFKDLLPPQLSSDEIKEEPMECSAIADEGEVGDKERCLFKANLWHSVWGHSNASQLAMLPSLFSELILPHLINEAQLLMSFYLVAPLMGALHAERPARLIDLTAELYRAVLQVDSSLAAQCDECVESAPGNFSDELPTNTGPPLVHVDTIADLLYHIKYMYVGNGVLDQVRPILPKLRPNLRKRLKFILPPSEALAPPTQQSDACRTKQEEPVSAVYEGRVYRAATKPPLSGEDF